MKKNMSLADYVLAGHFLKVSHISMLKASTIFANRDGKSKSAFLRLKKINDELLQIRCDIEQALYRDFRPTCDEIKLRQRYLGPLDTKLFKGGAKTFFYR